MGPKWYSPSRRGAGAPVACPPIALMLGVHAGDDGLLVEIVAVRFLGLLLLAVEPRQTILDQPADSIYEPVKRGHRAFRGEAHHAALPSPSRASRARSCAPRA